MKKSGTYVKKTCQYIMKKVMIMIEFFTICTWFCYVIISTNFWKNKINKKCTTCEKKKTQIPIVKIKNIFWCIGAYLFNYKIPQFSPKKIWIFRGGFFTSEGEGGGVDCSLHPQGLFRMFCSIPPLCRIFIELSGLTVKIIIPIKTILKCSKK